MPLHILVKVKAINLKLESLVSEVNQRLCAKFGANWPLAGAINRETSSDMKVDQICTKFGECDAESLLRPVVKFSHVWSKWAWLVAIHTLSLSHFQWSSHYNKATMNKSSQPARVGAQAIQIYNHTSLCITGLGLRLPSLTVLGVPDGGREECQGWRGDFTTLLPRQLVKV